MDRIKRAWKLFNVLTRKGLELYPVSDFSKKFPELNEVREISANIPLYFVLVEEQEITPLSKIYKSIIFTEEILLSYLKGAPVIKLPQYRTLLIAIPAWIYLDKSFLTDYTYYRGKIENSQRLIEYAEKTRIPNDLRGRFINTILKVLSSYNTKTILGVLDSIENSSVTIRIPDQLKQYFEEKYR
jgi:hypothetical protein